MDNTYPCSLLVASIGEASSPCLVPVVYIKDRLALIVILCVVGGISKMSFMLITIVFHSQSHTPFSIPKTVTTTSLMCCYVLWSL